MVGGHVRLQPADGQQKLMLARLQSVGSSLFLAEVEKAANLEAKFRQGTILGDGQIIHIYLYRITIQIESQRRLLARAAVETLFRREWV